MPDLAQSPVLNYSPHLPALALCYLEDFAITESCASRCLLHLSVLSLKHKIIFCQFQGLFPFQGENTDAQHVL